MSNRISDDELDPTGDPGLDFVNTIVSTRGGPVDLLDTPDSFVEWIERVAGPEISGLVPPGLPDRRTLTGEAVTLREAIVTVFRSVAAGSEIPGSAGFVIGRALLAARGSYGLERNGDGTPIVRTHFEALDPSDPLAPLAALSPIAAAAVEVAGTADPSRLRECDAPACSRWFVDTSKGGRRRWCSMARCGNRVKAARYRERRAD